MSLILSGIALGAGLFGSGISMGKQADARKRQEKRTRKSHADIVSLFEKEYNQDVLETPYAKGAIKKINEAVNRSEKRDAGTAAIMGSSDEAVVAKKGERLRGVSEAVTNLAMHGEDRKERMLQNYMRQKMIMEGQLNDIDEGEAQSWTNLSSNIWGATGQLIDMLNMPKDGGEGDALDTGTDTQTVVDDDTDPI